MKAALYKEGGVLLYLILLFVSFETIHDFLILKKIILNYYWIALALAALLIWGIHHQKNFSAEDLDPQEWPE